MSSILFSSNMVLLKNTLLLFAQLLTLNELRFKIMFFLIIFWLHNSILVFFLSDNHGSVDTSLRFRDKIVQT
jgi:hypothetical protein